jgi:hypothetical protein
MNTKSPISGNVAIASKDTRGWFLGHFGPDVPHSFRSDEESLVLTVRWPSLAPERK